jgi:hypothetical protein
MSSSVALTLTLKTIDCVPPLTAYFKCVDTEYEEVYDWLVRAFKSKETTATTSYYLVRLKNIGWVRFEDAKMVEDFLEENYL